MLGNNLVRLPYFKFLKIFVKELTLGVFLRTIVSIYSWKQSLSSLHSAHIHSDQPDPYQRCYPKEKVYPKEIPVPPPDSSRLLGPKRDVHLYRQKNGGFGFSLRRSTISERDQTRHTVLFAEPGTGAPSGAGRAFNQRRFSRLS